MVPIEYPHSESKSLPEIDETLDFPLTQPGLLLFTSGTTGAPKGVMIPRQIFSPNVTPDCEASDVAIAYRAVNGLPCILNLIDTVYVGALTEIFTTGLQPGPIWERLRGGDVTVLAGAPRFWQVLVEYYDENLRNLPEAERQLYDEGARNLRVVWFGGGMPLPGAKRFWLRMREKEWTVKYGSSELGREAMVFRFSNEEESLKVNIRLRLK
jgi:malonyl-CoA/methylmalonyl-CoA synthetase